MARRADPKRIFAARRLATRNVLHDEGMRIETAEAWCDEWELEADTQGFDRASPEFWVIGLAWIHEQGRARKLPT